MPGAPSKYSLIAELRVGIALKEPAAQLLAIGLFVGVSNSAAGDCPKIQRCSSHRNLPGLSIYLH
jgi:hypothetical protein